MIPQFEVDETTLVFAFRYALGRQTSAPGHMIEQLKRHWPQLAEWTQRQIQRDIERAIVYNEAEDACDKEQWGEILTLPVKDEFVCESCGAIKPLCLCSHED